MVADLTKELIIDDAQLKRLEGVYARYRQLYNTPTGCRPMIIVNTPAGPVTFICDQVQVIGKDGSALGGAGNLQVGQQVRVYFIISEGARAREIDIS